MQKNRSKDTEAIICIIIIIMRLFIILSFGITRFGFDGVKDTQ